MNKNKGNKEHAVSKKKLIINAIGGMLMGVIFTIAAILIFALIVKQVNPEDSMISAINQIIKIIGIGISAFFGIKRIESGKWLAGGLSGLFYIIGGYLVFSAIEGRLGNGLQLLSDSLLGILVGIIFAVIFGQLFVPKKKKK